MAEQALILTNQQQELSRFMPVMNMSQAIERRDVIVQAVGRLMHEGQDYGTIPGTSKPTLYQPGADKLCNLFGLVPHFETMEKVEDWTGQDHGGEPFFYYKVQCSLIRDGHVMGQGDGSCNSWESKYRWRKTERACPQCGKETIIKGKEEFGGGWLCWAKKGGCGAKFKSGDQAIEQQVVGQKPNPDIFDIVNTILKMASKRAKIGACLNATSAHEYFSQDEDAIASMQNGQREPQFQREPEREERSAPPQQDAEVPNRVVTAKQVQQEQEAKSKAEAPPEALAALWLGMKDFASTVETIEGLKATIVELVGNDRQYYSILAHHGMAKSNELRGRRKGDVRAVVQELWEFIENVREHLTEPPVVEDADIGLPPFGVEQPEKAAEYPE